MTVIPLPRHGQWAWDLRREGRRVRISAHVDVGLLNLSLWRGGTCVGTAQLCPADVAKLANGLTEGLAEIATQAPTHEPGCRRRAARPRTRAPPGAGRGTAGSLRTSTGGERGGSRPLRAGLLWTADTRPRPVTRPGGAELPGVHGRQIDRG
ncbi:hypothetical protein FHU33_3057 [Blastococcus colisei]|uniref:Uncharacterized protein n=1 Tax=Blastococcus colisei TaxID=1564162 RepID=A0A543PHP4_9ACTN|nr:hypothetical protein FHU33_3057 [Blastococcus colisei]